MSFKAKELTEDEIKAIRASTEGQMKLKRQFGIKQDRVKAIKEAVSLEEAMKFAKGMAQAKAGVEDKSRLIGGSTSLSAISIPKTGVAVFTIGQDKVDLFPQDIFQCYDEYRDMRDLLNWQSDFSSTLREGAKMYRAIMCKLLLGGKENE